METKQRTCRICLIEKPIRAQSCIDIIINEVQQLVNINLKDSIYYPMFICVTCASDIRFALRVRNKILESELFIREEIERLSERDGEVISIDSNSNSSAIEESECYRDPEAFNETEDLQPEDQDEDFKEITLEDYQIQKSKFDSNKPELVPTTSDGLREMTQSNEILGFEDASNGELIENLKVQVPKNSTRSERKVLDLDSEILENNHSETLPASTSTISDKIDNIQIPNQKSVKKRGQVFCDHCEHATHYKKDLMLHLFKHFDIKNFSCEFCDRQFRSETNLTHHRNRVHLNLRCEKCKKIMGKCETLDSHHCKVDKYRCRFCQKTFVNSSTLNRHTRSVHLNLKCNECHQRFSSAALKENHNCKIEKIRCSFCQKNLSHSRSLKRHVAILHHNLDCKKCRKIFSSAALKQNHDCEIKKYLKCNECHQRFSSAALKENHDCNKYRCNYCPRIFSSSTTLKLHTKSFHLNLKCKKCLQIFSSSTLKENHTCEVQNYQCNICEKNFMRSISLKIHTKIKHLNLKCKKCRKVFTSEALKESHDCKTVEYRCTLCPKVFMESQALKGHTANVHLNLKCWKCHKMFESTALKENHDCKTDRLLCELCPTSFSKSKSLKLHIRNIHLKLNCKKCHRSFSTETQKKNHDCQIKEYQCNICQQKLSSSSCLMRHIKKLHPNLGETNHNSSAVEQLPSTCEFS